MKKNGITKHYLSTIPLLVSIVISFCAKADTIAVVVSVDSTVNALSKREIIDIYMGRYQSFPNGNVVNTYDYEAGSYLRQQFYQALTGQNENKIQSYWARLLFTGRAVPPEIVKSTDEMLRKVISSRHALGYLPGTYVDDRVRVIYELEVEADIE